jgi:Phage integrase family
MAALPAAVAWSEPDPPAASGPSREQIRAVLAAIPAAQSRDRLLFRLLAETGLRIGEALGLYIEDLDLTSDDEHLIVVGKGGRRRTVLLDDSDLVAQLRAYLKQRKYTHGPLFRAEKNGRGGPLRYQSVQGRWRRYCEAAGTAGWPGDDPQATRAPAPPDDAAVRRADRCDGRCGGARLAPASAGRSVTLRRAWRAGATRRTARTAAPPWLAAARMSPPVAPAPGRVERAAVGEERGQAAGDADPGGA